MYYAAETTDVLGFLLTGAVPPLDAACLQDLRRRILTEDLEPGIYLDEVEISETYGISRPPVREVLRQLMGEGGKRQVKDTTNKLLAATDWMVIRKAERGVAIPADTVAYRAAVLAECDRLLAAITVAANVQELTIVLSNQAWPEVK